MSKDILLRLEGQDHASDLRDQFLGGYDNKTRESIIIDVEMTTIPVLLGVCFLVGIIGNGALFYTICKAKKFRNVPNSFLLNIAVTNTIMLIICPPMIATSYVLGMRWPFGGVACKLIHSIPQATLAISMFSLLALSIERYGAFAAPPKHRGSAKNRACVGNLVIWIIGCLCGLPMAMFAKEQSFFIDGEADKTIKCGVFDKQLWSALYPKIHTTVSICFLFVLPLILCLIFYMSLSCVVCAKKQREGKREEDNSPLRNGGRSSRSGTLTKTSSHTKTNTIRTIDSRTSVPTLKRAVRRRRTMAKVSILLMLQFTILWAPRWTYTVWYYYLYDRETLLWYLMDLIGLVCIYLNAALTPFTIVMFNRGFRHHLGKYLCCCCSCLHCCTCFEKKEKLDSPLPSTSDVSVEASPKRRRCCVSCCSPQTHSDQDSDTESQSTRDAVDKSGYKQNPDLTNLYQELPGQNFYDSYTIPPSNTGEAHHSAVYSAPNRAPGYRPYGAPYGASYRVPYDAVRPVESGVYYPSSYHGDERTHPLPYDGPAYGYDEAPGAPQLLSYHPIYGGAEMEPRYISEPQLHAQAPKYSKIMPSRPIRVGQATSIREIPAM